MVDSKNPAMVDEKSANHGSEISIGSSRDAATIYVDPEKEKACLKKFDKYFLPQAFIFLLLNYLDRSNVRLSLILT